MEIKIFILIFHPTAGVPGFNLGCLVRNVIKIYILTKVYICKARIKVNVKKSPEPNVNHS